MRRLTFLIAFFSLLLVDVNAQTLEKVTTTTDDVGAPYLFIPKELTMTQEPMLFTYTVEKGICTCYFINDDFSIGKEFQIILNDSEWLLEARCYSYGKGTCMNDLAMYFTQTFFNDDDKIEYIRTSEIEDGYKFEVVNEDNEVLFTVALPLEVLTVTV